MTKIIDMRMIVPYKSFLNLPHYTQYHAPSVVKARKQLRYGISQSVLDQSMSKLINEMDELNVIKSCTFIRTNDLVTNSDLFSLLKEYPDQFIGIPHIDHSDLKNALTEIESYVINGPCRAIYMEPGFRLSKIVMDGDDERIFPIYELCEKNHIPILLQYGGGVNKIDHYKPSSIDHIMETFPNLNIAITHGGWPQVMAFCQLAYRYSGVYLIPDCYFTKFPGSYDFQLGANGILQDKIMFGSTYPSYPLKDMVAEYKNAILYDDVYEKIMYENAVRFLGLADSSNFVYADTHVGFESISKST